MASTGYGKKQFTAKRNYIIALDHSEQAFGLLQVREGNPVPEGAELASDNYFEAEAAMIAKNEAAGFVYDAETKSFRAAPQAQELAIR